MAKVDATEYNIEQLEILQDKAAAILLKVNELNQAAKDAGNEGLLVVYQQDTYQTDGSLVPYITATVSLEL